MISSEHINKGLFYFPEEDPYSLSFQECGLESKFFLLNMGFPLYIILGHATLVVLYFILYLANLMLKLKYLRKFVNFLATYLFFNGLIRLYMEIYLGMALASVLNMHTVDWQSPFKWVTFSNYSGLVALILITTLPILLFVPFYCCKRANWNK